MIRDKEGAHLGLILQVQEAIKSLGNGSRTQYPVIASKMTAQVARNGAQYLRIVINRKNDGQIHNWLVLQFKLIIDQCVAPSA